MIRKHMFDQKSYLKRRQGALSKYILVLFKQKKKLSEIL